MKCSLQVKLVHRNLVCSDTILYVCFYLFFFIYFFNYSCRQKWLMERVRSQKPSIVSIWMVVVAVYPKWIQKSRTYTLKNLSSNAVYLISWSAVRIIDFLDCDDLCAELIWWIRYRVDAYSFRLRAVVMKIGHDEEGLLWQQLRGGSKKVVLVIFSFLLFF